MKPIVLFAMIAVAASVASVGALGNEIALTIQQFGVGSGNITSPIDAASVDFEITPIPGDNEIKNLVTACSFHSDESIEGDARIICKLTNDVHKVVAEGELSVPFYEASERLIIPINNTAFDMANDVRNIHDVTLVVIGPNPTIPAPPP